MTKDLGASWQYLKSYVFDFAWGYTVYSAGLTPPFNSLNVESVKLELVINNEDAVDIR